jgi:hypothetical protein
MEKDRVLNDATRRALFDLVGSACDVVPPSRFSPDGSRYGIAFYDMTRDKPITEVPAFKGAVAALELDPASVIAYGRENANRLAIQFVYNTCRLVDGGADLSAAFEATWTALQAETADPNWTFAAVANINCFAYDGDVVDLGHGVTICGRSFEWLMSALRWDQGDLDRLSEDWSAGGHPSSYVLVVLTSQPKSASNLILASDGTAASLAARALLGMRLHGAGDVYVGRMFVSRPAQFNVGIGGRTSSGWTIPRFGTAYTLTGEMIPRIREQINTLLDVEQQLQTSARHIGLALRSFTSIYDRLIHQGEDCIIDAITALEALWKLDSELSFRLSFRTSSLLGKTDDDRGAIFETLRKYYRIRSKIVHGSALSAEESSLVHNDEPLRDIVRRALRAFIHLLANPTEWTVARLASDPDPILLHSNQRMGLQSAMAVY